MSTFQLNHPKINLQTYKFLQKTPLAWYCIKCFEHIVPFGTISPMRNSSKQTKDPKLSLLSLQNTTPHLARISLINSMKLWTTLLLKQFPANTTSPVSFHLSFEYLLTFFSHWKLTTLISEHNLTFEIFGVSETKLRLNKAPLNCYNTWVQLRVYCNWMQ